MTPAPNPPVAVVLLSGGMDSTTAVALYASHGYQLVCLAVDYRQRHVRELKAAAAVASHYDAELVRLDLAQFGAQLGGSALTDPAVAVPDGHYASPSMEQTVVPNRNAVLANLAVAVAVARQASVVVLGVHAGDHAVYPDCRPQFIDALSHLVRVANGDRAPRIAAPWLHQTKTDIARQAAALGAPLHLTWSCYRGGDEHCGTCGTCYERREAFRDAGLPDPTTYTATPELTA